MSHDGITNHIDSEASESAERRRLLSLAARAGDHATYEELIGFERILAKSRVLSRARIESKTFGGHARRPTAVRILVVDNGRRKSRLVEKVKFKSSARLRRRGDRLARFHQAFDDALKGISPRLIEHVELPELCAFYFEYAPGREGPSVQRQRWNEIASLIGKINSIEVRSPLGERKKLLRLHAYKQHEQFPRHLDAMERVFGSLRMPFGVEIVQGYRQALPRLQDLAIRLPTCLSHGDLHRGNLRLSAKGALVIDWDSADFLPVGTDVSRYLFKDEWVNLSVDEAMGFIERYRRTLRFDVGVEDLLASVCYQAAVLNFRTFLCPTGSVSLENAAARIERSPDTTSVFLRLSAMALQRFL